MLLNAMTLISRLPIALILIFLVTAGAASPLEAQDTGRRPPVLRSSNSYPTRETEKVATNRGASRVSPTLVTIPAVVMDRNGRYIANLRKDDFRVYEDGIEQNIAYFGSVEKPFTVALLLDVSGSTQYEMAQIRSAANTFVGRLRSNDRLMAFSFDGKINVLTEPQSVGTIRQEKLFIPAATDGTVLYDAVALALKKMEQIRGRKAIVIMSDGVDQSSTAATLKSTIDEIAESDVLIYTVQYNTLPQLPQRLSVIKSEKARRKVQERLMKGYALSEPYMRALADKTGGRFYKADDLRDVGPAFEAITAELGVQYSLSYFPKENSGEAERSIKVKVRYPNLVVRARDSYTTAPTIAMKE